MAEGAGRERREGGEGRGAEMVKGNGFMTIERSREQRGGEGMSQTEKSERRGKVRPLRWRLGHLIVRVLQNSSEPTYDQVEF